MMNQKCLSIYSWVYQALRTGCGFEKRMTENGWIPVDRKSENQVPERALSVM
jgi:hypothetical protein